MKIAYLSVFYPYRGGIAQFNAALYRELEKEHEVKAFTFTRQYPEMLFPGKTQLVAENDTADRIPAERTLDSINPLTYIKTANKIKNFAPDLLLIQNWMPFFAPGFGWVAGALRKKGVPVIYIVANMKPHEAKPGDTALNKYLVKRSDAFVVMAEEVKNDLLELKPDAEYFYHPHPNYEHFGERIPQKEARNKLEIPQNKKVILFFGLVRKYKGLDVLIRAMKYTPDDYFLLIAGEIYGKSEEYEQLINDNMPAERVQLNNRYINDDEVPAFFSAADVCALPYRSATQSGIIGIAYHFGVPVITTDVGGLKEVVEPYGTGIVLPKPEEKLLHDALISFFNENMQQKCAANVDNFKRNYTWQSYAEGLMELYEKIKLTDEDYHRK